MLPYFNIIIFTSFTGNEEYNLNTANTILLTKYGNVFKIKVQCDKLSDKNNVIQTEYLYHIA